MKIFIVKSILFISVFACIRIIPNLAFDDFIFFRFWESAAVSQETPKLPFFEPNINKRVFEEGDLNHGMSCSTKKSIHWFTDKYGFRNRHSISSSDFMIVGCSNALGLYCDYSKTFAGLLNRQNKVYNISPDYDLNFTQSVLNIEKPQHIKQVFMVQVARYFTDENQFDYSKVPYDSSIHHLSILLERIKRNYFGNKIKSLIHASLNQSATTCTDSFHYYGTIPSTEYIPKNISKLKGRLSSFNLPITIIVIPEKEYYKKGDTLHKKVYAHIIQQMQKNKLKVMDISAIFSEQCYFHGDGHINEIGHQKIYELISKEINSFKSNPHEENTF